MLRLLRIVCLAVALCSWGGPVLAQVTVTFHAHPGNRIRGGYLLFPHAYLHATGALEATGEPVDWSVGFTARNPGPQLLFASGPGVVAQPEQAYVHEGRTYARITISDDVYRALRARSDFWASPDGSRYDLRRRNCITFIADMARTAGLTTGKEPSMSPGRFMEELALLNPEYAVSDEGPAGRENTFPARDENAETPAT